MDSEAPRTETAETNPFLSPLDLCAEYREMLAQQTINDLRAIAEMRGIDVHGNRKEPIIEALANQLSDLEVMRAEIELLAQQPHASQILAILAYMHLTVAPGYGVTAESLAQAVVETGWAQDKQSVRSQLKMLRLRGLLLSFSYRKATYLSMPHAVRICLPRRPGLVPSYPAEKAEKLAVYQRSPAHARQALYATWEQIAEHATRRRAGPPRQPIENQLPQLQEWDHLASEIEAQTSQATRRGQMIESVGLAREPLTIPVPSYRLGDADHERLREQYASWGAEGPASERPSHLEEEIDFVYALLAELGTVSSSPGAPVVSDEKRFQQFLKMAPSEQTRAILHAWVNSTTWSEMEIALRASDDMHLRRNSSYSTYKPSHLYREWRAGRETVLRFLSLLDEGRWYSTEGFLKRVYELNPQLLHSHSHRSVWWIESRKAKKQFGTTLDDWQQSFGQFIISMLTGPLFWLGVVQLGYASPGDATGEAPDALQITPVGALAFGREAVQVSRASPAALGKPGVEMGEEMTVTLRSSAASSRLHDLLHLVGELQKATPDHFVYQITAGGVQAALEQGESVESITATLAKLTGLEVPAAWEERMRAWSQNHGKFHVYDDLTLVELADDYALLELLANTSLREKIVYQFSPRLLAIHPEAVDMLVQEMEKQGYTPRVE